MDKSEIVASFPQMANYAYSFKYMCEQGLEIKYLIPPPITRNTLEVGSSLSPDYVCAPFKYCMGTYVEALSCGANLLMQIFGGCRLDYYGELNSKILKDLGYKFEFFDMSAVDWKSIKSVSQHLKTIHPDVSLVKVMKAVPVTLKIMKILDEFEFYIRKSVGFEVNIGEFDRAYKQFISELGNVSCAKEVRAVYRKYKKIFYGIKLNKPQKTIKVGMIGDYYTVQEPFSNYFMERELAKFGIEVIRTMSMGQMLSGKGDKDFIVAKKYASFKLGATANSTVAEALEFAKMGFDGIIQVKSFGCTPEIDAMPILRNISRDYNIPILHFSFDSQTSETGVRTRIEAFYDMIVAKKGKTL